MPTVTGVLTQHYQASQTLSDSEEWVVTLGDGQSGPVIVTQIAHGGSCDVELATSSTSDTFTRDRSVQLDSLSGEGVSSGNEIGANNAQDLHLVITNTSGGEADFIVTGQQVGGQ